MTSSPQASSRVFNTVVAPLLVILSGISSYVGAGFAVALFEQMPATTVAWLRVTVGTVVLLAWRRPWRRAWSRRALLTVALFGIATATMNLIFYASIAHIAMGTAVSLEFMGPVVVALATGRGWRPRVAAGIALAGVVSIGGLGMDLSDPRQRIGVLLALAAGAAWAVYILLGKKVAGSGLGIDGLAVGTAAGALVYAPLATPSAGPALTSLTAFAMVVGVGVLSTVVPYALDQVNMGRLAPSTFSLLLALMPATSLVVGILMLSQIPTTGEVVGLVLVSIAVALAGSASAEDGPHPQKQEQTEAELGA